MGKKLRVLVLMHEDLVPPDTIEGLSEKEIALFKTEYDGQKRRKRKCVMCGKRLPPARSDAKYCSSICRQRAYRRRTEDKE